MINELIQNLRFSLPPLLSNFLFFSFLFFFFFFGFMSNNQPSKHLSTMTAIQTTKEAYKYLLSLKFVLIPSK